MKKYVVTEDIEKSKGKTITKGTILELKNNGHDFYLNDEWVCSKNSYNETNYIKEITYKHTRSRIHKVRS